MAVGKTVAGKKLARRFKWSFIDLDQVIETHERMTVEDIFSKKGESYFRKIEKEVLKTILERDCQVIATGGGAVLDAENLYLLKQRSIVICLKASPRTLCYRSNLSGNRPLLPGKNRLKRIQELLALRESFYNEAHICIDTENISVNKVVEKIAKEISAP